MIDIGVNLADRSFDSDRDAVIDRAVAAGVRAMIVTGTDARQSAVAADLAAARPGLLYATAGIHPHYAASFDDTTTAELRELLTRPEVVAVGETGLDFYRDLSPRPQQAAAFEAHLDLAAELGLPCFLHDRDASETFTEILRARRDRLGAVVVHCFTGTEAALRGYLDLDLHVGITGWICDERRGGELQRIVELIPDDRLLIETDAPYLLPRTLKPRPKTRRNEPCWLGAVRDQVAACRSQTPEVIAEHSTRNARRVFGLPEQS